MYQFHPTLIRNMTLEERLHYGLVPEDIEEIVNDTLKQEIKELEEDYENEIDRLEEKVQRLQNNLQEERGKKRIALFPGSSIL